MGKCFLRVAALSAATLGYLPAQDSATPDATEAGSARQPAGFFSGLKITAVLDAFYSANLNLPTPSPAQFRNFDSNQGLELNAAAVSVERQGSHFGFRLDTGFGEMFRIMSLPDPWGGPNRYISQAYVSYRPVGDSSLDLDFGKFYTSAGAEGPETYNNFNYSRSLLFVLGEPYYHFGLRASFPVTSSFKVGVQLMQGWNDVVDNNSAKTIGLTSSLARSKWSWSQAFLTGPEKTGTNAGFRNLYDTVVTITPAAWATAYAEGLWAADRRVDGGLDRWSGIAGAAKFSLNGHWSLSPRIERFYDTTGFTTGTPQAIGEATATLEYRPASFLILRSELRRDWSNQPAFEANGVPHASKEQTTALMGMIFVLRNEH